ncbi:MAG: aryl-alcohol dehydrogenase-like predicted oxidoreductase [Hyphomicrobiaceae bacterium]|jgi:aryl-alcohol dehydrogenase-like predicted oxidoreductase
MKRRRLGRSGLLVSEICMGTMTFGNQADEAASLAILDRAAAAGVNFIDIAEIYPVPPRPEWAGRSEEICGKWLTGRERDSVIVATKIAGPSGGWFQAPARSGNTSLDSHSIDRAVETSLKRLGTDYIDLYQTHWPDAGLPYEETMEGLDRVVSAGKVRYVGCSNETAWGLMKSLWTSEMGGLARYETIQNNFSLMHRRFEDELARVCSRENVSLLPYSPLGGGVLTGKYANGAWPEGARFSTYKSDARRGSAMTARFVNEATLATTERMTALANDCSMTPATFATAWTLTRPFVGSTIIGATDVSQLDDTLAAADAKIPDDILAAVDRLTAEIRYPMEVTP